MKQTKKGSQWYFSLKAHVSVNAKTSTTLMTNSANVGDFTVLLDLLHGQKRKVRGDGGYQGQTAAIRESAAKTQDMTCRRTRFKR